MSDRVELIWYGDDIPWYDHGPEHPLRPARVILTRDLIKAYGIIDRKVVFETPGRTATDQELLTVHTEPLPRRDEAGRPWRTGAVGRVRLRSR